MQFRFLPCSDLCWGGAVIRCLDELCSSMKGNSFCLLFAGFRDLPRELSFFFPLITWKFILVLLFRVRFSGKSIFNCHSSWRTWEKVIILLDKERIFSKSVISCWTSQHFGINSDYRNPDHLVLTLSLCPREDWLGRGLSLIGNIGSSNVSGWKEKENARETMRMGKTMH